MQNVTMKDLGTWLKKTWATIQENRKLPMFHSYTLEEARQQTIAAWCFSYSLLGFMGFIVAVMQIRYEGAPQQGYIFAGMLFTGAFLLIGLFYKHLGKAAKLRKEYKKSQDAEAKP